MDELQTSAQAPADEEWRRLIEARLAAGDLRFKTGDQQFSRIRNQLAENGKELQRNTEVTNEIRDIVLQGKAFFKGMQRIGKFFAWCWSLLYRLIRIGGVIGAAGAAIWAGIYMLLHNGAPPK